MVLKGDSVLFERYYGVADMSTGERIGPSTRFNIASVSKQFTVAAVLQLMEEGKLDIGQPVSDFMDFSQPFWHDITLAHLASHSSGIPDSRDRSDRMKCVYATDETSYAYFPTVDTLKFRPGSDYDYLNPSFIILAKIVEAVTGKNFTDYQQENVFGPLGMTSTCYFDPDGMPANTAHAYVKDDCGGWMEYDYGEETFFATRPDGGIYSTVRDMARWESGLRHGTVLGGDMVSMAYSPLVKVSGSRWCDYQNRPDTWYGLGWFVDTAPGRSTKVYHTGDNGGFQAYVAKYPDRDIAVIVLENRNDRDRWQMATAIDDIIGR